MVVLQVGPEVPAELLGEGVQACVVQGGLAFLQVVDQQVTDRAPGQLIAVDQLGRAALPDGQQLGQRGRCVRAEGTGLAQQPPRHRAVITAPAVALLLCIQQFQEVADGHVGQRAALGRDEDRCPADGGIPRRVGDLAGLAGGGTQPGEPGRVAAGFQGAGQPPRADASRGQPAQRRPDDVGGSCQDQPDRQQVQPLEHVHAVVIQPPGAVQFPVRPGGLSAAGQPALLPGAAGLAGKPGHCERCAAEPPALGAGITNGERRPPQHAQHLVPVHLGGRPAGRGRPQRERGAGRCPRCLAGLAEQLRRRRRDHGPGLLQPGGHEVPVPNSTCSVSGRYPAAGGGSARCRAWRTCSP
jgi:hypothetical protein